MATYVPAPTFQHIPVYSSDAFVNGYRLAITGNTTFTLSPGGARAFGSDLVIQYPGVIPNLPSVITVDISTTGLGGCFPNSIASLGLTHKTMFPVYVIMQSSGTTGGSLNPLVAPSAIVATGNNFLPQGGWDAYRRVGWVYVDNSTGYAIPMIQSGHGVDRQYVLQDPFVAVSAGAATSQTVVDLTANDGPIPPNRNSAVYLNVEITPAAADGYACVEPGSLTAGSVAPVQIFGSVAGHKNSSYVQMNATQAAVTGNANIKYFVDNGSSASTINVVGFEDSLGNLLE